MDGAVATFQANLASTRTGRASVHMLDQVKVDYYGTSTPISQLAQVSSPEAQMILIAPWDPTILKEVEKAVRSADLGFNPISDGKLLRVPVPPMTEERPPRCLQAPQQGARGAPHRGPQRPPRRQRRPEKLAKEKNQRGRREALAREVQKMTDEEIRRMEELSHKKEAEVMSGLTRVHPLSIHINASPASGASHGFAPKPGYIFL